MAKPSLQPSEQLEYLFDIAKSAHVSIQHDFEHIDPIIGVSQSMRNSGVPADVLTVDCLRTQRRIILILHDHEPEMLSYQFAEIDDHRDSDFRQIPLKEMTQQKLYDWVAGYFNNSTVI